MTSRFGIVQFALLAACSFAQLACSSTQSSLGESDREWLSPSPSLKQQIDDNAQRLPWTHGIERIDLISWFARVGEPAYSTLLPMVLDHREDVSGAALAALGATRDSRLVEPLHALDWPSPMKPSVSLERARALLRLGDWAAAKELIQGLSDERLVTRALCAQALYETTRERFGFDPRGDDASRDAAIQRWNEWYVAHERDELSTRAKDDVAKNDG